MESAVWQTSSKIVFPHHERRKFCRIAYPEHERPILILGDWPGRSYGGTVVEISENGARSSGCCSNTAMQVGQVTRATIIFKNGWKVDAAALTIGVTDGQAVIQFREPLGLTDLMRGLSATADWVMEAEQTESSVELGRPRDSVATPKAWEQFPVGVCLIGRNREIQFANSSLVEMLGPAVGKSCAEYFGSDAGEPGDSETLGQGPVHLRCRNGHHYEVLFSQSEANENDTPTIGVVHDVTGLHQLVLNLSDDCARYAQLAEQSHSMVWEVDATGLYTFVGGACEQILGYTPGELVGKMHFFDLHPQDGRAEFANAAFDIFAKRESFDNLLNQAVTKTGDQVWLSTNGVAILDEHGALRGYRGSDANVTQVVKISQHNNTLQRELQQAQKMEAIGQLAGGIAHDFNNLLQVVMGSGEVIASMLDEQDPMCEMVFDMLTAASKSSDLIRKLLTLSRHQDMVAKSVDLNEMTEGFLKLLRRVIGEHITLEFTPGRELGTVSADSSMLEQVLMNLCVNARDAMGSKGTLRIETNRVTLDEGFCQLNPWARPGAYCVLSVADTGCGMDAATREHIFEPFFTTKDKDRGTGLGLATVYGIVRQHGGMVHVYSELGMGTVFRIYLPNEVESERPVAVHTLPVPKGGTETILFVEDEDTVRHSSVTVLERAGYTVIPACDGEEALQLFIEHGDRINMVLMDVVMPRLGGREAFERMKAVRPDITVLFMSGYNESSMHKDFIVEKGAMLLQKPYSIRVLLQGVRDLLDARARHAVVEEHEMLASAPCGGGFSNSFGRRETPGGFDCCQTGPWRLQCSGAFSTRQSSRTLLTSRSSTSRPYGFWMRLRPSSMTKSVWIAFSL